MASRALHVSMLLILLLFAQVVPVHVESPSIFSGSITYLPDDEWTATTPEEQGMTSSVLDEMIQFIKDFSAPIKGLIVARNGYIVKEQYWNYNTENSTHHIFSCTKSFTSTLVGIALREGFIDNVSQRVLDFFPEMTIANMDSRKGNMTLEHVLTMTTGLDWNEWNISYDDPSNMYQQMFGSPNPIQFFLDLPTAYDPGTHWMYTTGASHLLSAIITQTTGMSARVFAEQYLFVPLNITIGGWNTDAQGINNGGTQLYVTARTMAKLGLLYLNNGTWDGQEILTADYVARASSVLAATHLDSDYGYQWWIDTARDIFSAQGSEGQYIFVVPEHNIVIAIVARADEPGEDVSEEILQYVLDSVVDGTEDGLKPLPVIAVTAVILCAIAVAAILYRRR